MKRNNIDKLLTWNFGRLSVTAFTLFASNYMIMPLVPFVMGYQLDTTVGEAGILYLLFALGMFVVGPFHAYLGDAYKRKNVFLLPAVALMASAFCYSFVQNLWQACAAALVQGACFALSATAAITIAIDITPSSRRSDCNRVWACVIRLGMLAGVVASAVLYKLYGFAVVGSVSAALTAIGIYCMSRVRVAFRAPIGVPRFCLDRFLLPLAWLPSINLLLFAAVPGILLPLLLTGDFVLPVAALVLLASIALPFTKLFLRLSHHCERGSANTHCHLAMESGLLVGAYLGFGCFDVSELPAHAFTTFVIALLFFAVASLPYYKKYRVR